MLHPTRRLLWLAAVPAATAVVAVAWPAALLPLLAADALVVGLALVATALIYLVFARGLNVWLPLGVLESLAK